MRLRLWYFLASLVWPQSVAGKSIVAAPPSPHLPDVYSQFERHADECPPGHDLYGTYCNTHHGGGRDTRSPAFHLLCRPQVILPGRNLFSMPSMQPSFRCPLGYFCLSHGLGLTQTFARARKRRSDAWRPGKGPRPTIDCVRYEEGRIYRRPKGSDQRAEARARAQARRRAPLKEQAQARLRARVEEQADEASSSRQSIVVQPSRQVIRSEAFWRWNNHRRIRVIYATGLIDTPAASLSITELETTDSDSPDGLP